MKNNNMECQLVSLSLSLFLICIWHAIGPLIIIHYFRTRPLQMIQCKPATTLFLDSAKQKRKVVIFVKTKDAHPTCVFIMLTILTT